MEIELASSRLSCVRGDITKIAAEVIVNAANSDLIGGGGVDGAIHRAAGPALMLELNRVRPAGGCATGSAVITGAGNLPARFVVHAVGPVWRGGAFGEALDLADAYTASLKLAVEKRAKSVSFPSLSTGAYGYPVDKAAPVAVNAVADFLIKHPGGIDQATFVLFDEATLASYDRALSSLKV